MLILLLKAQPGLFDKVVNVAGSVAIDGTVRKPHTAIRHVRPVAPPAPKHPAKHPETADLFGDLPVATKPKPAPKRDEQTLDLFADRPEPAKAPEPEKPAAAKPDIFAESKAKREANSKRAADLAANGQPVKLRHRDGRTAMAGPDVSKPGSFRVTRFDDDGPIGHVEHASLLEAISDALGQGFEPVATAEKPPAPALAAKVDYAKPFDPEAVPTFGVPAGISKDERRRLNADGALIAQRGGQMSPADLATIRQYSGNGGCGDSLNEFYTDPKVAAGMWYALGALGVGPGAKVLEPSCATGVFMETAPAGVTVTGVELDGVSAAIAEKLHPGHEVLTNSLEGFAVTDTRQFDAVIGNAPFGLRGKLLSQDKPDMKTAEAYFMDTSLDKLRPGGVVAMIVPTGLLDSKRDRKVRVNLLRKGEFLGAMRMPNTAFEHSHTGVTSDVVFFRKREQDVAGALSAVDEKTLRALGVWDDEFVSGAYYSERGAANVLGTMTEGWRAKAGMGDDITVEGSMVGVPEAIADFKAEEPTTPAPLNVQAILDACPDEDTREKVRRGALRQPYDNAKRGAIKTMDGVQYILEGQPLRWHRIDDYMASKAVSDAADLAGEIEKAMADDGYAEASGLAAKVKAYVEAHGVPAKNHDLMIAANRDKSIFRLIGAVKPDGSLSDAVTGRKAAVMEASFDAAATTLAMEMGHFTPAQLAGRWHGGDADAALDHLYASHDYALDPASGMWTSRDQYLSGELWPKYDEVKAAVDSGEGRPEDRAKYERQLADLEATIAPKSLEDVEVMLNSAFLPLNVVAGFFNKDEKAFTGQYAPSKMQVTFDSGVYAVRGGPWGSQLLEKYLNRTGVRKEEDLPTIERWNREFKEWLLTSEFRDEVEELYNRKFRGFRQREYPNTPFDIPGLSADGLKDYQYGGLRWALEAGKGIIAADVGLGKTARGLILARMAKVTGRAKKPMICVPKSVLANWVAEAEKWFPGCSVMTIGETYTRDKNGELKGKEDSAADRNRKLHDLTQNDYDFVLISQPAWNDLDLDPEMKERYIKDDFWVQRGEALGNAGDKRRNAIKEAYEQSIAGREFQKRTDAIYFNNLGVDMLIADEMHAYKNLFAARNRFGQAPKFLGGTGLSNRALDMQMKTRWLREQNGGMNIYGLTATPTKNSPLEVYSMLSHIAPEAFEAIGVRNSEEFLDRFCEFKNENILTTGGKIEEALVTAGFKNLDELREIMRRYIDRKTAEDVGLKLPKRDDRQHLVDMSAEQQTVYQHLREQAELSKSKDGPHIFSVMDQMSKAAMDLELYDPVKYAGAHSPKIAAAVGNIISGAAEGGQVVFADSIAVHDKIVNALVAGGMPRDQIGVINAQVAASSSKRQKISDDFNAGKLKVVIGNTATMGEGINLQKGTTDIHHLDLPWEPASLQQRNGRGLRQGNTSEAVRIHSYIAKGSFDGYRYQTIASKKDWQDLLWNGGDRIENLAREGALSRDDLMVMLAADPEAARASLETNKELAKAKFEASRTSAAAETFGRYQSMTASLRALKNKDSTAARRLSVQTERMRTALEADPYFKAKGALDGSKPTLLHPETGEDYSEGTAFELTGESAVHGGGKFVVTGVVQDATMGPSLRVRRYGAPDNGNMRMALKELGAGAAKFDYSEAQEKADAAEAFAAHADEKMANLKNYAGLRELPESVIAANHDRLQASLKPKAKDYHFDTGSYADVGLIAPDGSVKAVKRYDAKTHLDTHDLMLPTAAHRKLATEAYIADEQAKRYETVYSTSRRGSSSSQALRYPGGYDQGSNRWGSIGNEVFGRDFKQEAHAEFEKRQLEAARRAPTYAEAVKLADKTVGGYLGYSKSLPKRALAVLFARAKREGIIDQKPTVQPAGMGGGDTVRGQLINAAKQDKHHDLAAAMALDGVTDPAAAARDLLGLPIEAMKPALTHLIAKFPEVAERKAGDLASIHAERRPYTFGGTPTPAHPLHAKFGPDAHSMTLNDLVANLAMETRDAA